MPTDFTIKPFNPKYTGQPQQISTLADTDVWFKQDEMFQHPKAII